jgi:hypothetical protein
MRCYDTACAGPAEPIHESPAAVYWHRELPPLDTTAVSEHSVEATSVRVPGSLARRSALWDRCYDDLMAQAERRLIQEVVRLHGRCAHVLQETIDSRHDDATGTSWLHGEFRFALLR